MYTSTQIVQISKQYSVEEKLFKSHSRTHNNYIQVFSTGYSKPHLNTGVIIKPASITQLKSYIHTVYSSINPLVPRMFNLLIYLRTYHESCGHLLQTQMDHFIG